MLLEAKVQTVNVIVPAEMQKNGVIGLQFIISGDAGPKPFHGQIRVLHTDKVPGRAKIGNYFATLADAAEMLNKTYETMPAGCIIETA